MSDGFYFSDKALWRKGLSISIPEVPSTEESQGRNLRKLPSLHHNTPGKPELKQGPKRNSNDFSSWFAQFGSLRTPAATWLWEVPLTMGWAGPNTSVIKKMSHKPDYLI